VEIEAKWRRKQASLVMADLRNVFFQLEYRLQLFAFRSEPPPADIAGPALAGLGHRWLIAPLRMPDAYLELARRRDQPGVRQILSHFLNARLPVGGFAAGARNPEEK